MSTLIVSVSGIRDDTVEHAATFAADLDRRGVGLSLLVAPRLKDKYRLRDVRQGPDGFVYIAVDNQFGQPTPIVRLEPDKAAQ